MIIYYLKWVFESVEHKSGRGENQEFLPKEFYNFEHQGPLS